jgi:predicted helicase
LRRSYYRPFTRQSVYFDRYMNAMVYRLPSLFPTARHPSHGFYVLNPGADKPFSVLMTNEIPDLALFGSNAGQYFAR